MKHYYIILESSHWNDSIDTYADLSKATKDFTDYSKFEELDGEAVGLFLDLRATRYIIDRQIYVVARNFVNIPNREHFMTLIKY